MYMRSGPDHPASLGQRRAEIACGTWWNERMNTTMSTDASSSGRRSARPTRNRAPRPSSRSIASAVCDSEISTPVTPRAALAQRADERAGAAADVDDVLPGRRHEPFEHAQIADHLASHRDQS